MLSLVFCVGLSVDVRGLMLPLGWIHLPYTDPKRRATLCIMIVLNIKLLRFVCTVASKRPKCFISIRLQAVSSYSYSTTYPRQLAVAGSIAVGSEERARRHLTCAAFHCCLQQGSDVDGSDWREVARRQVMRGDMSWTEVTWLSVERIDWGARLDTPPRQPSNETAHR